MLLQYFKQAIASLRESPLTSALTLLGTALSIAMMLVLWLVYQTKTSSFPPVSERSRILSVAEIRGVNDRSAGYQGNGIGSRIVRECFYPMTTPERITAVSRNAEKRRASSPGIKSVRECDVRETDAAFWHVFDFRFLHGEPFGEAAFSSARPLVVITDRLSLEFFGTVQSAGRTLQLDYIDFTVSGVVSAVSEAVTEAYGEVWIPYTISSEIMGRDIVDGIGGRLNLYLLARSKADFPAIRAEAQNRVIAFNAGQQEFKADIISQPYTAFERMFFNAWSGSMNGNFSGMLLLAALFLFLPVLNLLGLIFSQMQKRRSEIGLRKAFGATSQAIVRQVLAENLILTLLGGAVGILLSLAFFYMAKDSLLERTDVTLTPDMLLTPAFVIIALTACLVLNLLSSGVPAWRTARANVTDSLYNL